MRIALVAHDARKQELVEWCTHNAQTLSRHTLFGTGTTARLLGEIPVMNEPGPDGAATMDWYTMPLRVEPLLSGPLGGDQQIGAMIAEGKIDCLIFFCDNLITQGHQQDVGALVRLASLYNVAFATNRTTADMIMTSPLFGNEDYKRIIPGAIEKYKNRFRESEPDTEPEVSQEIVKVEVTEENGVPFTILQKLWDEISTTVKYKITQAKAQELNEVELGDGVFLNDKEKDALRSMGYTIYTNGNSYKLRWVNDGE
jgi:methylglyoxal synthase